MDSANVTSIDAIKAFRVCAVEFGEEARTALNTADTSISRTIAWITDQQIPYWKQQVRARTDKVNAAKSALIRKQTTPAGEHVDAVEEKLALRTAKSSLEEAERKLKTARRWAGVLEHENELYHGQIGALAGVLDGEWPVVLAKLNKYVEHLESYVQLAGAPSDLESTPQTASEPDAAPEPAGAAAPIDGRVFARLRRWTPGAELRSSLELTSPAGLFEGDLKFDQNLLDFVDEGPLPPNPDQRVTLGPGALNSRSFYLQRLEPDDGDSGWHLGSLDSNNDGPRFHAVQIADVLDHWPDAAVLLALPSGYLVVVERGSVRVVLDADDGVVVAG